MEEGNIYQALEDDFTSTFIRELMPGVLHNFANPLNGIMGRSKLLQRRIDDAVKKINERYPEAAADLQDELQRIRNDVRSVNKESESFFEIFRDASGKFYALAAKGNDQINLSQMLAAEMRFANFYLEFKHEITKSVQLDEETHEFKGNTAELSLVFWRLIRFAMSRALASEPKVFFLETHQNKDHLAVFMKYSGDVVSPDHAKIVSDYLRNSSRDLAAVNMEKGLLLAFSILKKYAARVNFSTEGELNSIAVTLPCPEAAR